MPRGRSPNREKAFELWKKSDGKRLLRDIAKLMHVGKRQKNLYQDTVLLSKLRADIGSKCRSADLQEKKSVSESK